MSWTRSFVRFVSFQAVLVLSPISDRGQCEYVMGRRRRRRWWIERRAAKVFNCCSYRINLAGRRELNFWLFPPIIRLFWPKSVIIRLNKYNQRQAMAFRSRNHSVTLSSPRRRRRRRRRRHQSLADSVIRPGGRGVCTNTFWLGFHCLQKHFGRSECV